MATQNPELRVPETHDKVYYFPHGDPGAKGIPAIVNMDCDSQRVLSLTILMPGQVAHVSACKHMWAKATPFDRERNGGWMWVKNYVKPPETPETSGSASTKKPSPSVTASGK